MLSSTGNEDVCVDSGSELDWGGLDFPGPGSWVPVEDDEGPAHRGEGQQKRVATEPPSLVSPEKLNHFHLLTLFRTNWWV